jgi:hypothetical protein
MNKKKTYGGKVRENKIKPTRTQNIVVQPPLELKPEGESNTVKIYKIIKD